MLRWRWCHYHHVVTIGIQRLQVQSLIVKILQKREISTHYLTVKNTDTPRLLSSYRNHCFCHLELEMIWKSSSKIMNKMIQMLQEKKWIGWINIKKKTKKNQSINISRHCSQDSLWIHIQIHSLCMELILEAKNWKSNI